MNKYQICNRCVMDNASDETIVFDENGNCNYCNDALEQIGKFYFPDEEGEKRLKTMLDLLKSEGQGKKYDCLMGISGGLDSSYLLYLGAIKWGLRILTVHIDDGYDTDIAKENIKNLCSHCNIDLVIEKPDAEQFNDLIRAFILAEVPNIAIPQDNILSACLNNYAKKYKIYNFLSGTNFALESILQKGNTYRVYDMTHNRDIQRKFGSKPITKLPMLSQFQRSYDKYIHKIKSLMPLNFIDYNKERAIMELEKFCGFKYYEAKHLENKLTKVTQLYWFPKKFKVDKRKSHYSSLIVSGQISRENAIKEMEKPMFDVEKMESDIEFMLKSINLSREQFEDIINRPGKDHLFYKTSRIYLLAKKSLSLFFKILK